MKTKLIASALIALSLATSASAFAQRNEHGNDHNGRNDQSYQRGNDRHDNGRDERGGRDERNDRYYNAQNFHRDDKRGGGPRHDMRRGQRLSQEYRGNRYIVSDWRERRLSAPPRGHQWVRAGNDYVLAAIATGIIAQVLLSN